MQDGGSIDCACYEMLNCSPFYPNRLCEHNPTDSIWIWQMPQTTGGQPRHPAWQFLKTASFSSAIVCMAMVAAMNWNRIILLIPEHQLCRLRHQRGEMRVTRTPPLTPSLRFIYSIEAKGQIMFPAHLLGSYPPLSGGMKQVQQCFEHINNHF